MTRATICIFAKPPVPGAVKTRLAEPVRAAYLARAFLVDTCTAVQALPWAEPVVATTGPFAPDLAAELGAPAWPQGDGDLGARIERVLARALAGERRAIAIGADSPGLPPALLEAAHRALETADAAIGPTDDGGFYLLAVRRCPEGLLAGLPWSRSDTFAATLARLRERGLSTMVLEPWFDVDRPADLERLRGLIARGEIAAPATARALAEEAPRISVIVPVLDEEKRLDAALTALHRIAGWHEVIVVDGGSTDRTVAIAQGHGVRVVRAPRGRGTQLDAGAAVATGDVVLFLHADTTLPPDAVAQITGALARPNIVAGAFRTWTVADEPRPWFAPLLHLADLRSRVTRYPYGDQAMFVRLAAFRAAGGFRDLPIMEDLDLSHRLWAHGGIHTCAASVRVSGRRFVARPIVATLVVNVFPLLFRAGVPPRVLAKWYAVVR